MALVQRSSREGKWKMSINQAVESTAGLTDSALAAQANATVSDIRKAVAESSTFDMIELDQMRAQPMTLGRTLARPKTSHTTRQERAPQNPNEDRREVVARMLTNPSQRIGKVQSTYE